MDKLNFSIKIDAPKEKVWDTMLNKDSYSEWTSVFSPGSYFQGDWSEGSKILFLDPKTESGMLSRIKENRKFEFISIEHIGVVQDGKEDTESESIKEWAGALENYTFIEEDGKTEVIVETDSNEEYKQMFQDTWPKALQRLKELSEK
jgi:hypothetical protein